MKTLHFLALGIVVSNFSCSSGEQKQAQQQEIVQKAAIQKAELVIEQKPEDANGTPTTLVSINIDGTITPIDTVNGTGSIMDSTAYATKEIPKKAVSAFESWWAGSGDYYYIAKENDKFVLYQGWQDEEQKDKGYHWTQKKSF